MASLFKNTALRGILLRRSGELLLVVALIVAAIYGHGFVQEARTDMLARVQELEQRPADLVRLSSVRGQLRSRQHDVNRILSLVIADDEVGDFVGVVEEVGRQYDIEVQIPNIGEAPVYNDKGQLIEPTGPHREVELEVVGIGEPPQLLEFLHDIEHLPYLVAAPEWRFESQAGLQRGRAGTGAVDDGEAQQAPVSPGLLSATLLLTVENEISSD